TEPAASTFRDAARGGAAVPGPRFGELDGAGANGVGPDPDGAEDAGPDGDDSDGDVRAAAPLPARGSLVTTPQPCHIGPTYPGAPRRIALSVRHRSPSLSKSQPRSGHRMNWAAVSARSSTGVGKTPRTSVASTPTMGAGEVSAPGTATVGVCSPGWDSHISTT